jgi:selenocysteine lyase/cysteine desulfurase
VEQVLAANRALIATAAAAADTEFALRDRGGTLCLLSDDSAAAEARLRQAGCRFDRRGQVLRLSFHVWNSSDEATRVGRALRGLGSRLA